MAPPSSRRIGRARSTDRRLCDGRRRNRGVGRHGVLVWPFDGADGPREKKALILARRNARVTCVAGHPASDVVAAGYKDGAVMLARLHDDATLLVRAPQGDPVTALSFDGDGASLGYEAGALGLCDLTAGR